ncbi:MAG: UDP-2,4-diacetamido-2,4,6-trideoxy-beta-L-altropyranose hydrolase [Acidobacteriota bacterium]
MADTQPLLIRADAGPDIGAGHLMRCLALAQAWRDRGGMVAVRTTTNDAFLLARLEEEAIEIHPVTERPGSRKDAEATRELAATIGATWLAIDGYRFGATFQDHLVDAEHKVLWIDDHGHAAPYRADVVLNPNLHATTDLYQDREPKTRLLLGSRYLLFRQQFRQWSERPRETPDFASRVLVMAGGVGSHGLGGRILEALHAVDDERIKIHSLASDPDEAISRLVKADPRIDAQPQVTDVPRWMATSHLAISAAGSTAWELAFMGLPALLVSVAENQRPVAAELARRGAALDLGWHEALDHQVLTQQVTELLADRSARKTMVERARALVDGDGVDRVVACLLTEPLWLRPVRRSDRRLLWEWANDAAVRQASLSSEPIPWQDHLGWFERQMSDGAGPFWIAMDQDEKPIGQVRFDIAPPREAEIHISIANGHRHRGHGPYLLQRAAEHLFGTRGVRRIHAHIKPDNLASARAFQRAGYQPQNDEVVKGQVVKHYVLEKPA